MSFGFNLFIGVVTLGTHQGSESSDAPGVSDAGAVLTIGCPPCSVLWTDGKGTVS